jgi:hypothetical protein
VVKGVFDSRIVQVRVGANTACVQLSRQDSTGAVENAAPAHTPIERQRGYAYSSPQHGGLVTATPIRIAPKVWSTRLALQILLPLL